MLHKPFTVLTQIRVPFFRRLFSISVLYPIIIHNEIISTISYIIDFLLVMTPWPSSKHYEHGSWGFVAIC